MNDKKSHDVCRDKELCECCRFKEPNNICTHPSGCCPQVTLLMKYEKFYRQDEREKIERDRKDFADIFGKLQSENAELKEEIRQLKGCKTAGEFWDKCRAVEKENAELRNKIMFLTAERDDMREHVIPELKSRSEKLEEWIKTEIEIYCKNAKYDNDEETMKDVLESVLKKMQELKSGSFVN
jgi:hypothetical protein